MMNFAKLLPAVLLCLSQPGLLSCSTASYSASDGKQRLDLSMIEKIRFGQARGDDVAAALGKPSQVVHLKREFTGKDVWIYKENDGTEEIERVGLLVDNSTGIVESATWAIFETDPLHNRDAALQRFDYAKFTPKKVGRVAPDYFSDDSVYADTAAGIAILVDGARETVSRISFAPPSPPNLADSHRQ